MNHWQKRAAFAANESEGVFIQVAEYPGWRFKVGRDCGWNTRSARAIARVSQRPLYAALILRTADPDYEMTDEDRALDKELTMCAFVEGLLLDWEGVTDEKGKKLGFSFHNAMYVLTEFPDIYHALRREAGNAKNFAKRSKKEKEALAEGNSEAA